MSDWDEARYLTLPEVSPYVRTERYGKPKEIFKHVVDALKEFVDPDRSYSYADVGCANGEFLYYLREEFPHWQLSGFDIEPAFVEVAQSVPGLADVRFEVSDLFAIEENFDFVSFMNAMSIFAHPEPVIEKLLSLVRPNGVLFADGYFNRYEVEVQVIYMDNSTEQGRGKWRKDWNQHTQTRIRAFLEDRCESVTFEDVDMSVELPRDPAKPDIDAWTFKDAAGRNIITNGTNLLLNDVMMIVRK